MSNILSENDKHNLTVIYMLIKQECVLGGTWIWGLDYITVKLWIYMQYVFIDLQNIIYYFINIFWEESFIFTISSYKTSLLLWKKLHIFIGDYDIGMWGKQSSFI